MSLVHTDAVSEIYRDTPSQLTIPAPFPAPKDPLYTILNTSPLVSVVDIHYTSFTSGHSVTGRFLFRLKKEYALYFPLLNGLFSCGKRPGVAVEAKKHIKGFMVISSSEDGDAAGIFLSDVFRMLQSEIDFKHRLRQIRTSEVHLKRQLEELYASQFQAD